jgi:hypothetical protein
MYTTYENLKSLVSTKALSLQYMELTDRYDLFVTESGISYTTTIYKANAAVDGINPTTEATRISDFETNYKAHANQPLEVKAGAGRPMRVSASPQPEGTVQHWKGFQLTVPAGQTSAYVDVAFVNAVYLRGGNIASPTIDAGDYVSADVLIAANNAVYIPGIISNAYLISDLPISFESNESMAFPTSVKLRITLTLGVVSTSDTIANILVNYFE